MTLMAKNEVCSLHNLKTTHKGILQGQILQFEFAVNVKRRIQTEYALFSCPNSCNSAQIQMSSFVKKVEISKKFQFFQIFCVTFHDFCHIYMNSFSVNTRR